MSESKQKTLKTVAQCRYCSTHHVFDELLQWRNMAAVLWSFSSINGSPPLSPFSSTPFSYPQLASSRADCLHPPAAEPPLQLAPPLLPPWHLPLPSSSAHTAADHGAPPCELGFLPWRLSPSAASSSLPLRFPWLRAPPWTPSSLAMEPPSFQLLPVVHVQGKVEEGALSQWRVGPRQGKGVSKFQIFALPSNIHISSFIASKIMKFVLLASLWNALTSGSICWHVLVEKFFCRNS